MLHEPLYSSWDIFLGEDVRELFMVQTITDAESLQVSFEN